MSTAVPLTGKRPLPPDSGAANAKRSAAAAIGPTVGGLQQQLQLEVERRARLEESVDQLRLELQLMGRLLASAREQLAAAGAPPVAAGGVALRTPPAPIPHGQRVGRSKNDAKIVQRMQDELAESKAQSARLAQQVEAQQQRIRLAASAKRELLTVMAEVQDYISVHGHGR